MNSDRLDDPSAAGAEPLRRGRGRPPLALEEIVARALRIVDEEGADALSMRALAQRLGSGTATLYRHFDGRAGLVAATVDRVLGEADVDLSSLDSATWQDGCRHLATQMFSALSRHRNILPLLVEQTPLGPNMARHREHIFQVLLDAGFPPRLAILTFATLARHILGFAVQLGPEQREREDHRRIAASLTLLKETAFPATTAVVQSAAPVALEEEFSFGLELLLNGLAALLNAGEQGYRA